MSLEKHPFYKRLIRDMTRDTTPDIRAMAQTGFNDYFFPEAETILPAEAANRAVSANTNFKLWQIGLGTLEKLVAESETSGNSAAALGLSKLRAKAATRHMSEVASVYGLRWGNRSIEGDLLEITLRAAAYQVSAIDVLQRLSGSCIISQRTNDILSIARKQLTSHPEEAAHLFGSVT